MRGARRGAPVLHAVLVAGTFLLRLCHPGIEHRVEQLGVAHRVGLRADGLGLCVQVPHVSFDLDAGERGEPFRGVGRTLLDPRRALGWDPDATGPRLSQQGRAEHMVTDDADVGQPQRHPLTELGVEATEQLALHDPE